MTEDHRRIIPVILSGGSGTRLWPLSREDSPKQLLPLASERTLLQETVLRCLDRSRFASPIIIANAEHRLPIGEQLRQVGVLDATVILEPLGRNTAPAAVIAAQFASRDDPDAMILLMPADHVIRDVPAFHEAIKRGAHAAEHGKLVLFGIRPAEPAVGYGYIKAGNEIAGSPGVFYVEAFVEKPDAETAQIYLDDGAYLWNGGIFLMHAQTFLNEAQRLAPDLLSCCRRALSDSVVEGDSVHLAEPQFRACPSISIDYAIMEKTRLASVVPVDLGWNDIGSWSALWSIADKDSKGNVLVGNVIALDASGCYLRSEERLVAALGVEDLIVVVAKDAILITRKNSDQKVRELAQRLKSQSS